MWLGHGGWEEQGDCSGLRTGSTTCGTKPLNKGKLNIAGFGVSGDTPEAE